MTRKVSDIVVDLEKDVKDIKTLLSNNKFLYEVLLGKINAISKHLLSNKEDNVEFIEVKNTSIKSNTPDIITGINNNVNSDNKADSVIEPKEARRTMPGLKSDVVLKDNKLIHERAIPESAKASVNKFTPTQQKILYPDGTAVSNANVEIKLNDNVSFKTKTNTAGKWTYGLNPGIYSLRIYKKGNNKKPEVNINTTINILESKKPHILNNIVAEI